MPQKFQMYSRFLALGFALLSLVSESSFAAKKEPKFPQTSIVSFNYNEGITEVTPGTNFLIDVVVRSATDFPEAGKYQLPVALYLVATQSINALNKSNIAEHGLYLGKASIRSPKKGENSYILEVAVQEALRGHEGSYSLVAWLDPKSPKSALFTSGLSLSLSDSKVNQPALSLTGLQLDQSAILADESQEKVLGGQFSVESKFGDVDSALVSACFVSQDGSCTELPIWDPQLQNYAAFYRMSSLLRNDRVTTLFQLKLPPLQASEGLKIKLTVTDEAAVAQSAEAEANFGVFTPVIASFYEGSDYANDVRKKMAEVRAAIRKERLKGKIPNPLFALKKSKDGKIDLAKTLKGITTTSATAEILGKVPRRKIVPPATPTATPRPKSVEDSASLPPGLVSSIPGSRFNMPDQDFPWLVGLEVKADPPPPQYNGVGFPNIAQFRRCIPFFCGPNSPSEAGQAPSESCIRRFCGSTFEDIRFGGRNPNLIDVQTGFDKSFSGGGFGARLGIGGQAKVYRDKAISDYVAASYQTNAFFGVKVFNYSVPIFEVDSQSVYSPTEIGESMSRNLVKILGRVIERKEETSGGLSFGKSLTYGVKKEAEVGVGPFDIDVEVEAGGTGGINAAVGQIDILRGIQGSLTPYAQIGAKAKATTDVGVGSFGVSGELILIKDSVPVVATFNAGLDISAKKIRPQLNLNITNILEGPSGRIDLILEVGVSPFRVTYSTKLASFSTGSFRTSIYNKDTIFAEIPYN